MASFLGEIKRRKVFQVAAAYAVVGWLLIEVASVLLPTFQAPDWVMRAFSFAVIAGFPLAVILAWAFDLTPQGVRLDEPTPATGALAQAHGHTLNFLIQGLVLVAVGFLIVDQYLFDSGESGASVPNYPTSPSTLVRRTMIDIGSAEPIGNTLLSAHVAISPDGSQLAFAAQRDGVSQLYLRLFDLLDTQVLSGTEDAYHPTFTPDGDYLLFTTRTTDRKMKRISTRGGRAEILMDSPLASTGSWIDQDSFVWASQDENGDRQLFRVQATTGESEILISPEAGSWYVWPEVLPDRDSLLFVVRREGGNASDGYIAAASLSGKNLHPVLQNGYRPRYVPTGHIVFMRSGSLWAVPFDLDRLETAGPEVPVVNNVQGDGVIGGAAFAFSNDGTLVYAPGEEKDRPARFDLVWVDREGRETLAVAQGNIDHPRFSPDGERITYFGGTSGVGDVWVYDLGRGTPTRLTFEPGSYWSPQWTPDGQFIVFGGNGGLRRIAANGTGQVEPLHTISDFVMAQDVSPDGSFVLFSVGLSSSDLYALSLVGEREARVLLQSSYDEDLASISPDGSWMVYQSDKSGRYEVYVRPFPDVNANEWQISSGGGTEPLWSPAGGELFYRNEGALMAVSYDTEPTFSPGIPMELFQYDFQPNLDERHYDVTNDGQRFLVERFAASEAQSSRLIVVQNWFEELRRLAPPE